MRKRRTYRSTPKFSTNDSLSTQLTQCPRFERVRGSASAVLVSEVQEMVWSASEGARAVRSALSVLALEVMVVKAAATGRRMEKLQDKGARTLEHDADGASSTICCTQGGVEVCVFQDLISRAGWESLGKSQTCQIARHTSSIDSSHRLAKQILLRSLSIFTDLLLHNLSSPNSRNHTTIPTKSAHSM